MRTKRTIKHRDSGIEQEGWVSANALSPDLQTILAWKSVETVTITWADRITTFTAIEYECECCGSYEHSTQLCPELQDPMDEWGNTL